MTDRDKLFYLITDAKNPAWGDFISNAHILDFVDFLIANGVTVQKLGRWEECDWVEYDGHGECIHYPKAALRCTNCCTAFKKELLWKRGHCPNCGAEMTE